MSEFRLPAALKVRTIKVAGIVRRHCDLGPIWGRNTAEVEKVHTQNRAQKKKLFTQICAQIFFFFHNALPPTPTAVIIIIFNSGGPHR